MELQNFDWTYFRRRIYINNSTKEELFKKWATPKGLAEWFIAESEYKDDHGIKRTPDEVVKAGDDFIWTFHIGSKVTGKILDVQENSLFKFTFGENEPGSKEEVIVTVTIHENDGNCYFDILQDKMSTSNYGRVYYYISSNMGWMFHMNNLKSLLETGNDLRIMSGERMHVDAPSGYPLEEYKWTEFNLKEYFNAPREKVFNSWTTSNNIAGWFIAKAVYTDKNGRTRDPGEEIQAGDQYKWTFYQGFTMEGKILEVRENEYLSFTFGKKEPGSDEDVIVELLFSSEDSNKTKIDLCQNNIADSEFGYVNYNLSCITGWTYFLTNLRSVLEYGFDLREKDKAIAQNSNAYTLPRNMD